MNADEVVKTLRHLAKNCDGSHKCFHANVLRSAADEINHQKAEITGQAEVIESIQAQRAKLEKRIADEGFCDLETMISKYKTVMLAANETSIEQDEEIESLKAQLAALRAALKGEEK